MTFNNRGLKLIKQFEGLAKVKPDGMVYPYLDMVGVPTIGYGMTYYPNGVKVSMKDKPINPDFASYCLRLLIRRYIPNVKRLLKVPLTDNQFSALISFAYNLGTAALAKSTLLKKVNAEAPLAEIEQEWMKWVHAGGKKVPGLVRRREAEFELFKTI